MINQRCPQGRNTLQIWSLKRISSDEWAIYESWDTRKHTRTRWSLNNKTTFESLHTNLLNNTGCRDDGHFVFLLHFIVISITTATLWNYQEQRLTFYWRWYVLKMIFGALLKTIEDSTNQIAKLQCLKLQVHRANAWSEIIVTTTESYMFFAPRMVQ